MKPDPAFVLQMFIYRLEALTTDRLRSIILEFLRVCWLRRWRSGLMR
jgi:hypothetical protein